MSKLPAKTVITSWFDANFLATLVVAVIAFSVTMYFLVNKVDSLAISREQSQLQNSLKDTTSDLAAIVAPLITWDEAVENLDNHYNREWAEPNIGHFFCATQGFNYVFIVDRNDQTLFSMHDNQIIDNARFQAFRAAYEPIQTRIRAAEIKRGKIFRAIAQGGNVSVPIQETDIVRAGNDLVLVTFTLVQPDFGLSLPIASRAPIVMTGRIIDPKLLKHFSDRLILSNLHLAKDYERPDATVALTDQFGATLGHLAWTPYRPAGLLFEIALLPIFFGIGTPLVLYLYSRRTSQLLRKTLLQLTTSEERWTFALEGSGDGVWDLDLATRKIQLSNQLKAMLGYAEQQVGDNIENWLDRIHPDDRPQVVAAIQASEDPVNRSFSIEHRVLCKDGSELWILNRGMAVTRNASGKVQRMVGTFTDISKHKQMEIMKSQFVSSVSHELRTPVTSIRGSLGLLESGVLGELPPKAHEMVAVAHKNSLRLLKLVNDILDMDKLLSGTVKFRTDPVNLVDMVHQSMEANSSYGDLFQVTYQLTERPDSCTVIGDDDRIMQVMSNLLSNAAKFSMPGSVVTIRIKKRDDQLAIEIEDHGSGIPVESQHRIFSPFFQASNGDTRKQGSTGLGLNISKRLVENMNGRIGFSSSPETGTVFWFSLPIYPGKTALPSAST